MARTYIPSNPTWVCDILFSQQDTMTLNVCADTAQEAGDAAIEQAIRDGVTQVQHCNVYEIRTGTVPVASISYDQNKHTPKVKVVTHLKRVK
jgi:hypothetical protein